MSDMKTSYRAIGLMSGTSMDGIDAAVIDTDGEAALAIGASHAESYDEAFRERLASVMGGAPAHCFCGVEHSSVQKPMVAPVCITMHCNAPAQGVL